MSKKEKGKGSKGKKKDLPLADELRKMQASKGFMKKFIKEQVNYVRAMAKAGFKKVELDIPSVMVLDSFLKFSIENNFLVDKVIGFQPGSAKTASIHNINWKAEDGNVNLQGITEGEYSGFQLTLKW